MTRQGSPFLSPWIWLTLLSIHLLKAQPEKGGPQFRKWLMAGAAAVLVVVLVLAGLKLLGPTAATPIDPETKTVSVIVPDVDNRSGDPAFDGVLEQLLSITLGSAEPHDLSKDVVL